jgi:hypothetical protein
MYVLDGTQQGGSSQTPMLQRAMPYNPTNQYPTSLSCLSRLNILKEN